jgi:hypothetical protein
VRRVICGVTHSWDCVLRAGQLVAAACGLAVALLLRRSGATCTSSWDHSLQKLLAAQVAILLTACGLPAALQDSASAAAWIHTCVWAHILLYGHTLDLLLELALLLLAVHWLTMHCCCCCIAVQS